MSALLEIREWQRALREDPVETQIAFTEALLEKRREREMYLGLMREAQRSGNVIAAYQFQQLATKLAE